VCSDPVEAALETVADAGSCTEADAVRCGESPFCQGDAGGLYHFGSDTLTCDAITGAVASKCDGGLPDGGYWTGAIDRSYCDTALGSCYFTSGIYVGICVAPVEMTLASIADAGSCAEADAVRCVYDATAY
jgi:hypothetical protein